MRRVGATADGCCIGPRNALVGTRSTASPSFPGKTGTQWNASYRSLAGSDSFCFFRRNWSLVTSAATREEVFQQAAKPSPCGEEQEQTEETEDRLEAGRAIGAPRWLTFR